MELKTLDIKQNNLRSYLGPVPADLLAKAVPRLMRVNLGYCNLSDEQTLALFEAIQDSEELELKNLDIKQNNLRSVPSDILANAICRLEEVNLEGCNLSNEQIMAVLERIGSDLNQNLTELDISQHEIIPDIYNCELVDARRKVRITHDRIYDPWCDHGWDESHDHILGWD